MGISIDRVPSVIDSSGSHEREFRLCHHRGRPCRRGRRLQGAPPGATVAVDCDLFGGSLLVETAPDVFVVRLQDFAVRNGPDLYVYLSSDSDGYSVDAVELGRLKADRGNQNYRLPANADVGSATSVVVWCKQFGVLFATAPLS